MKAVIQRVSKASVGIDGNSVAEINQGLLILLGIGNDDGEEDSTWLSKKIAQLRIFNDHDGLPNLSLQEVNGEVIVVSQFTLHAKTKKGNRPSYIRAARPEQAIPLYEHFKASLGELISTEVQSGEFGANMQVSLVNDGPLTILIDTKNKD
ncbi:MAG: D-aminoacyl-tRNA deacylase [Crocinitomicaceae bacterium]|nr:D-aminoacyl-tRNA deacylase [Crocinitomicaceae bacterium]